jgi:hypothetical protein
VNQYVTGSAEGDEVGVGVIELVFVDVMGDEIAALGLPREPAGAARVAVPFADAALQSLRKPRRVGSTSSLRHIATNAATKHLAVFRDVRRAAGHRLAALAARRQSLLGAPEVVDSHAADSLALAAWATDGRSRASGDGRRDGLRRAADDAGNLDASPLLKRRVAGVVAELLVRLDPARRAVEFGAAVGASGLHAFKYTIKRAQAVE